jgi:hypothetical protein
MKPNQETAYWHTFQVITMARPRQLVPYGLFTVAQNFVRLEWALATLYATPSGQPIYLAQFLQPLLILSEAYRFESIGKELTNWYDKLPNLKTPLVPSDVRDSLRHAITRWHAIMCERLQDLYLITPVTALEPTKLIAITP